MSLIVIDQSLNCFSQIIRFTPFSPLCLPEAWEEIVTDARNHQGKRSNVNGCKLLVHARMKRMHSFQRTVNDSSKYQDANTREDRKKSATGFYEYSTQKFQVHPHVSALLKKVTMLSSLRQCLIRNFLLLLFLAVVNWERPNVCMSNVCCRDLVVNHVSSHIQSLQVIAGESWAIVSIFYDFYMIFFITFNVRLTVKISLRTHFNFG